MGAPMFGTKIQRRTDTSSCESAQKSARVHSRFPRARGSARVREKKKREDRTPFFRGQR